MLAQARHLPLKPPTTTLRCLFGAPQLKPRVNRYSGQIHTPDIPVAVSSDFFYFRDEQALSLLSR